MEKVDFFLIGAPKCGTTALAETLNTHPDVFIPDVKEPHFFCTDWPNFQRYSTLDSYASIFESGKINGDASVWYLYSDAAPKDIYSYNPKAKIIVCLREPEKMIPSLHNQLLFSAREVEKEMEAAWCRSHSDLVKISEKRCLVHKHLDYKDVGMFYKYIKNWEQVFGKDNVEVVFLDEMVADPELVVHRILDFLSLKNIDLNLIKSNPAREHRFYWVTSLLMRPPFPLNYVKMFFRSFFKDEGRSYLRGLYSLLSKERKGYSDTVSDELKNEIKCYFSKDWEMVNKEYRK